MLENSKIRTATANSSRDESLISKTVSENNFLDLKFPEKFAARVYILEDVLKQCPALNREYFNLNSIHRGIYVSHNLMISLELKVGCKVILETIEKNEHPKPSSIEVFPLNGSITTEAFKSYAKVYAKQVPLLLNSYSMITLDNDNQCIVKLLPENYATIDDKDIKDLTIHIYSPINLSDAEILKDYTKKSISLQRIARR